MQYDLVFEGGGAKGMVFVGAMQEFEARGHKTGRLLGTSAGAITATLLAAGYTSSEMLAALDEKLPDGSSVFTSFMAPPGTFDQATINQSIVRSFLRSINLPLIPDMWEEKLDDSLTTTLANDKNFRHVFSLMEQGGWYSADNFLKWIESKLNTGKYGTKQRKFGGMTLSEMFAATKTELSLVASDTTGQQMLVLNHITAPDCPVIWATRMSMSIPLLWQEVIWKPEWGKYNNRSISGNSIVDGGLLSNFPIELFLSDLKDVTRVMGEKVSEEVLGFLIDEDLPVPDAPGLANHNNALNSISSLATIQRISRLVDTTLSARDKMVVESYSNLVVRMPAKGYGTTEFDMTPERKNCLVRAGKQALIDYFTEQELSTQQDVSFGFDESGNSDQIAIDRLAAKILR